jgi:hypothetical protein
LEKMYYKITTIISDINIEKDFTSNQFRKLLNDKEELQKYFKAISIILGS